MSGVDGPDFICVGMPKAGTGWLYDQLEAHPDFWMPPVKELVYLNREYPLLSFVDDEGERVLGRRERIARKRGLYTPETRTRPGERLVHRDRLDERDQSFLKRASLGRGKPRDLDFYASLFESKQQRLSGDITPPYCNIPDEIVAAIARRFPSLKVLLLVREPVARVWSRICMAYAGNTFDPGLLNDAGAFQAYIRGQHKLGDIFATQVLARWQKHAPNIPVRVFFFDELEADPARLRQDILLSLGADPQQPGSQLSPNFNRKAKKKLEMTPTARDILVNYFREEILASAEAFGGPARAWPATYGL